MQRKQIHSIGMIILGVLVLVVTLHACGDRAHAATASCYGPGLFGNSMASGAVLNEGTIAVAHKTLDLGSPRVLGDRLMIYSGTGTARMMAVRDRGPYAHGRDLDITQAGVQTLGFSSCRAWGVREVRTWRYPYGG